MSFGIAIPTYNEHISHLDQVLCSIASSTILPDIVSISCSSLSSPIALKEYPFKIIWTETAEYRTAGQNRNIAASKLDTDVISFIDSDDVSTPFRNEYLIDSFKNREVKAAVHSFIKFNRTRGIIDTIIKKSDLKLKVNYLDTMNRGHAFPVNSKENLLLTMHCGHITLTKDIFDRFRYNEIMKRTQDVEFLQRIVSNGVPVSYIENELTYYRNDE